MRTHARTGSADVVVLTWYPSHSTGFVVVVPALLVVLPEPAAPPAAVDVPPLARRRRRAGCTRPAPVPLLMRGLSVCGSRLSLPLSVPLGITTLACLLSRLSAGPRSRSPLWLTCLPAGAPILLRPAASHSSTSTIRRLPLLRARCRACWLLPVEPRGLRSRRPRRRRRPWASRAVVLSVPFTLKWAVTKAMPYAGDILGKEQTNRAGRSLSQLAARSLANPFDSILGLMQMYIQTWLQKHRRNPPMSRQNLAAASC